MSTGVNRSQIFTIAGVTALGGLLAYGIYFDYKRRNDASFRRKIRSQKKKVNKAVAESKEQDIADVQASLQLTPDALKEIHEAASKQPLPVVTEERHQFFIETVGRAEALLAAGPQLFLDAAILFYQAMRVYPSPMELISIYQKTVPEPILMVVLQLYNLDAVGKIAGYFESFPDRSMNVRVKKLETQNGAGEKKPHVLIAAKDFKAGDVIYTETPVVAALDADVQGRGTHCSHCMKGIAAARPVVPEDDKLRSVYCSEKCHKAAETQSLSLLIGKDVPLPVDMPGMPPIDKEARSEAQQGLVNVWQTSQSSAFLMTAKLAAMQVLAELGKVLGLEAITSQMPELCVDKEYTIFDHMERLHFNESPAPDGEHEALKNVLNASLPFLDDIHTDERHASYRAKLVYNSLGVAFDEGRNDKYGFNESSELSRTSVGSSKQVGSGLYVVSAYLSHSCNPSVRPTFPKGTTEMHLVAKRNISEGEELTMAYVDTAIGKDEAPFAAYKRRRMELETGWNFSCTCSRCEAEAKVVDAAEAEAGAPTTKSESEVAQPEVTQPNENEGDASSSVPSLEASMEASDISFVEREPEVGIESAAAEATA